MIAGCVSEPSTDDGDAPGMTRGKSDPSTDDGDASGMPGGESHPSTENGESDPSTDDGDAPGMPGESEAKRDCAEPTNVVLADPWSVFCRETSSAERIEQRVAMSSHLRLASPVGPAQAKRPARCAAIN